MFVALVGSFGPCTNPVWFSLFIDPALVTFILHPHALALAILHTLNLDPRVHILLNNLQCGLSNASSFSEQDASAMIRKMGGSRGGRFRQGQAIITGAEHFWIR